MKCEKCGNQKLILFTSTVCEYCENTHSVDVGYLPEIDGEHQNSVLKGLIRRTKEAAMVDADDYKDAGYSVQVWKVRTQAKIEWNELEISKNLYVIHRERPKDPAVNDAWLDTVVG